MRDYLAALLGKGPFATYMASEVVMTLVDVGQEISGRDAVEQAIIDFHWVAFDTRVEIRSLIAGAGTACAEMVFVGKHTGDFVGIPATGRGVRVPYVAVWDLEGDRITALRLYGPAGGLIQQLSGDETA